MRTSPRASVSPAAPSSFSIRISSPAATRYCLPPVLITANMIVRSFFAIPSSPCFTGLARSFFFTPYARSVVHQLWARTGKPREQERALYACASQSQCDQACPGGSRGSFGSCPVGGVVQRSPLDFIAGLGQNPASPCGEVPEWSNGAVSKTVVPLRVPRVRIPLSPPLRPAGLVSFHELAISSPSSRGLRSRVWNRDGTNSPQYPRKPRKSQTAMFGGPSTGDFPDGGGKTGVWNQFASPD